MSRLYSMGILVVILFLNIPNVRGDLRNKITFYRPGIIQQLTLLKNKVEPATSSILRDLAANTKTTLLSNGTTTKTVNYTNKTDTTATWTLDHLPSITPSQFDAVLRDYSSPATGIGQHVYDYAHAKQIDNAYVLFMFIHESTAGTNKNWAGMKSNGDTSHNPGNIICAGYTSCYNGFRDYTTWEEGFDALIDLLVYYRDTLGDKDIDAAIYRWAPPSENDTTGYIQQLKESVTEWRSVNRGEYIATTNDVGIPTTFIANALPVTDKVIVSNLTLTGCLVDTVPHALSPSPALQEFVVPANTDWSFNEHWVIVSPSKHWCGTVEYGGVCDMATRYNIAAKELGLSTVYQRHPGGLNNVEPKDAVVIESNGKRGGQDLVIVNNTNKNAHFTAKLDGNVFSVSAWFEL